MSLDDIVDQGTPDKSSGTVADPEDLSLSEMDWKYVLGHYPDVAYRLFPPKNRSEEEIRLVVELMEEILEGECDEFSIKLEKQEQKIESVKEDLESRFL